MSTIPNLPKLVRTQFKAAQESGDLNFYQTSVAILKCYGFPFQLRFSPALADKPKGNKDPKKKPIDPFESPSKALFVTDVTPEHYVVLNKFPVIPDHFILATKNFKQQTDLLEEGDFEAAWECMKAYGTARKELFGFFNSGDHSGASQPHRHIQFLPVESMLSGIEDKTTWSVLVGSVIHDNHGLPFVYFSSSFPKDPTPDLLHNIYLDLHKQAEGVMRQRAPNSIIQATREKESIISYNLGLTDQGMVLVPRISEGLKIKSHDGNMIGPIALNGTVLGGTLLVKSEEEWDILRNDESKLTDILRAIGLAPNDSRHL